jgi:uncharacterized protein YaiI (UPF0178 family)
MTGDDTDEELDEVVSEDATDENIVLDTSDDNFADTVVEANVDALIARMDSKDADELALKRASRKRLEELREQESDGPGDTFNFNLDDDL